MFHNTKYYIDVTRLKIRCLKTKMTLSEVSMHRGIGPDKHTL